MAKYGFDNFVFEQIDSTDSIDELNKKEQKWISYYQSDKKQFGYNLDSGGKNGGKKSNETKRKIGISTKQKWENPEIAKKMKEGLQKGTDTIKHNKKRYPFTCPICGNTIYLEKAEADKRTYCSNQCVADAKAWEKGVQIAAKKNHEDNIRKKTIIKDDVVNWCLNNEELVLNCPYNKIRNTLKPLNMMLIDKYGIKDFRSIFICFDVKNMKSLLDVLKKEINSSKENVC